MKRHFLSPLDLSPQERLQVLRRAAELKKLPKPLDRNRLRAGALFFNPSLRTRISFEQASQLIGGTCQTLNAGADLWKMEMDPSATMDKDSVECVAEAARVMGRMFHLLGIRAFPTGGPWEVEKTEPVLKAFAEYSGTSIISLEGAMHHPCQGLADELTMLEHSDWNLKGRKVVLSWAWHPKHLPMAVPNTYALQSALAGANLVIARPDGYDLDPELMAQIETAANKNGGSVSTTTDQPAAVENAFFIYTKSWGTMLNSNPAPENLKSWTTNRALWEKSNGAKIMHCLPVRRNIEISSDLLDSEHSIVTDEAENRLWAQAALIEFMAKENGIVL